jgi:hypothetical protein
MIKEDKVLININLRNSKNYKELGYDFDIKSVNDKITLEVPVSEV